MREITDAGKLTHTSPLHLISLCLTQDHQQNTHQLHLCTKNRFGNVQLSCRHHDPNNWPSEPVCKIPGHSFYSSVNLFLQESCPPNIRDKMTIVHRFSISWLLNYHSVCLVHTSSVIWSVWFTLMFTMMCVCEHCIVVCTQECTQAAHWDYWPLGHSRDTDRQGSHCRVQLSF